MNATKVERNARGALIIVDGTRHVGTVYGTEREARRIAASEALLAALEEIASGDWRVSRGNYEAACHVIDRMEAIARDAILKATA